ncbi:hypothetical protein KEM55_004423, partial [Ascosphaera atra]
MGSGPSIAHLMLLVFEAVMEVVCVSLPGYIIARMGHFDAESQKFIANLNVMLFTPCLATVFRFKKRQANFVAAMSQLGQLLRWSWGYRVLLAPKEFYIQREEATIVSERLESGPAEDPERSHESTVVNDDGEYSPTSSRASQVPPETRNFNVKRKISFSTFAKQVNDNSTAPSVADGEDAPLLLPPDTEF